MTQKKYLGSLLKRNSYPVLAGLFCICIALHTLIRRYDRITGLGRHMSMPVILICVFTTLYLYGPIVLWHIRLVLDYACADTVVESLVSVQEMEKMYIEWSFFPETNEDMLICYRRKMNVFFSIPCRGFGTYYVDERLCGRRNLERIFYSTKKGSQQYLVTRTKYARVILVIENDRMPEKSWSFEDIQTAGRESR